MKVKRKTLIIFFVISLLIFTLAIVYAVKADADNEETGEGVGVYIPPLYLRYPEYEESVRLCDAGTQAILDKIHALEKTQIEQEAASIIEVKAEDLFTKEERHALAKLLWGEARGIDSDTEKAAVIWCVLNRVDSEDPYYPDDILGVVKQRGQFAGYKASHPIDEYLLWIVDDVLVRWATDGNGRVLPSDYLFFASKASEGYAHNYFRKLFKDPGPRWDWSLPSPYDS